MINNVAVARSCGCCRWAVRGIKKKSGAIINIHQAPRVREKKRTKLINIFLWILSFSVLHLRCHKNIRAWEWEVSKLYSRIFQKNILWIYCRKVLKSFMIIFFGGRFAFIWILRHFAAVALLSFYTTMSLLMGNVILRILCEKKFVLFLQIISRNCLCRSCLISL